MLREIKKLIKEQNFSELQKEISKLDEIEIAEILEKLDEQSTIKVFSLLPKNIAAHTFSHLKVHYQHMIIKTLSDAEAAKIIDEMAADDATDLIVEMPSNVVTRVLANTTPETRKDINHLLHYPEDSAGSIMTVEFLEIKANNTISEAISEIRKTGLNKETIDFCYVLDNKRKLLGTISLKQIILAPPHEFVHNIMKDNPIYVTTLTDQEIVARKFQKYDITVMPVVDSEKRLVGIITVDDVVDIMQEETTEDIEKMAAIVPTEKPYLKMCLWDIYKSRMPWLLFLMISATFTGGIISNYEQALSKYATLTMFIPMIMGTGGNAGGQSSVTIIRALSLKELEFKDSIKVLLKESLVGIICGLTLSICNFFKLILIDKLTITFAIIVCIALFLTVLLAKIIGSFLPILADKLHLDPAVMANPIITTIVDALSLIVYFQIASIILQI